MVWSCTEDARWKDNKRCLGMDPNWEEKESRPKTTWGRTAMKEMKEIGLSWSEAQAKAWDRVQWWGMIAALRPSQD